jgi:hypothetical protein
MSAVILRNAAADRQALISALCGARFQRASLHVKNVPHTACTERRAESGEPDKWSGSRLSALRPPLLGLARH